MEEEEGGGDVMSPMERIERMWERRSESSWSSEETGVVEVVEEVVGGGEEVVVMEESDEAEELEVDDSLGRDEGERSEVEFCVYVRMGGVEG